MSTPLPRQPSQGSWRCATCQLPPEIRAQVEERPATHLETWHWLESVGYDVSVGSLRRHAADRHPRFRPMQSAADATGEP